MADTRRAQDWSHKKKRPILIRLLHLLKEKDPTEKILQNTIKPDPGSCQTHVLQYFYQTLISCQTRLTCCMKQLTSSL